MVTADTGCCCQVPGGRSNGRRGRSHYMAEPDVAVSDKCHMPAQGEKKTGAASYAELEHKRGKAALINLEIFGCREVD